MSEHYKIIRRTREAVKDLKTQAWTDTKIAKYIGVSVAIIKDIVILDEVAMNLREPTIEKFRKFNNARAAAKQHLAHEAAESKTPPIYVGKKKDTTVGLLAELTELSVRFVACGYRMDASLTMIHTPDETK